jgi:uncharacterized protein (DUF1330 family)
MPGYVIAEVTVTHPEEYARYREMVPPTVAKYGGRFVVRGGKTETVEGEWTPTRLVVIEFESAARAREWWASEEYREAKGLRQRAARSNVLIVEGA